MKRVLKWLAFILGGLIGLALLALVGVYFMSEARMNRTYMISAEAVAVPTGPDSIAEGKRLYQGANLTAGQGRMGIAEDAGKG